MSKEASPPPSGSVEEENLQPTGRPYMSLIRFVEGLFEQHGDTHSGLGYPKPDHFEDRYKVYLDVMRFGPSTEPPVRILDIGCATGCVLDEIKASGRRDIVYRGIDLSEPMIKAARLKHPEADFVMGDPFDREDVWVTPPDYVLLGGIFPCRLDMSREQMTDYMLRMLRMAFARCRYGIAFNVMSKHVDWERDDLFHVPFDEMAELVGKNLSRNYVFRADYGLYEYTTYVYK